jgi:hypothetical protein
MKVGLIAGFLQKCELLVNKVRPQYVVCWSNKKKPLSNTAERLRE